MLWSLCRRFEHQSLWPGKVVCKRIHNTKTRMVIPCRLKSHCVQVFLQTDKFDLCKTLLNHLASSFRMWTVMVQWVIHTTLFVPVSLFLALVFFPSVFVESYLIRAVRQAESSSWTPEMMGIKLPEADRVCDKVIKNYSEKLFPLAA